MRQLRRRTRRKRLTQRSLCDERRVGEVHGKITRRLKGRHLISICQEAGGGGVRDGE